MHAVFDGQAPVHRADEACDLSRLARTNDSSGHSGVSQHPGDGDFALLDYLRAAPSDVPLGIECPSLSRAQAGLSATDQAKEGMAKMKRLLGTLA